MSIAQQETFEPHRKAARSQFVELYGSLAVMNTYLKIAVVGLCAVLIGLVVVNLRTVSLFRDFRPLVIRINEVGRAEPIAYASLAYQPQEAEIKYFLIQFVKQHYGRIRATVRESYAHSFYFLDARLANALIEENKKYQTIETFLIDQSDEIEIRVKNVSIGDLRSPPFRATVDFEKIYYAASNRAEKRREQYVGNIVFTFRERVSNEMIPINPLGFTITYFREDQAF